MTKRYITLLVGTSECHDNVCFKNANVHGNKQTFKAIKPHLKSCL